MDGDDVACASRSSPRSRKHARDSGSNGIPIDLASQAPASKRHRRSNGIVENSGNGDGHSSGDAMEIDRNGYSHPEPEPPTRPDASTAAESPAAAAGVDAGTPQEYDAQTYARAHAQIPAQAQATMTLTNGNSVGVQSEKIAELGPETTILDVGLDRSVMHTAWHPTESAVLATAGEALARIWTVSRSDSPKQHVDLLEPGDRSLVTALSWSPDGEFLAVATRNLGSGWMGEVAIWTKAGIVRDVLPAAQDMMLALRWNSSGSLLLGVASSGKASSILIWDPSTGQALQPLELEKTIVDAAWTGDSQFFVCGEDTVTKFSISDDHAISITFNYTSRETRQNWSIIRWDPVSSTTAVAAEETACLGVRAHLSTWTYPQLTLKSRLSTLTSTSAPQPPT